MKRSNAICKNKRPAALKKPNHHWPGRRRTATAVLLTAFLAVLLMLSVCSTGCALLPEGKWFFTNSESVSSPDFSPSDAGVNSEGPAQLFPVFHSANSASIDLSQIPPWSEDRRWVEINGNRPFFTEEEITDQSFEEYGELDALGRCTGAFACVGTDLMPEGERESIAEIRPTGWHNIKYAGIDGDFLYNRCHLIAFGLTGENANERNLITGTRYMNTVVMNDFEYETIAYIHRTGNHVMYRVTPVFQGNDLVASGVLIEALSAEDSGLLPSLFSGLSAFRKKYLPGQTLPGICFCIYIYNVQPGVTINYATGDSTAAPLAGTEQTGRSDPQPEDPSYVINIYSGKFHRPDCTSVEDIQPHNRRDFTGSREELIAKGYAPCGICKP